MNLITRQIDDEVNEVDEGVSPEAGVFIVDDDQFGRNLLKLLIADFGFPVEAFESAESFLEKVPPTQLGCMILDIRMPKMDGFQLLREMKARAYRMPVIMITGYGDWETGTRAKQAGAMAYLEKPYEDDDVLFFVKKALAKLERTD